MNKKRLLHVSIFLLTFLMLLLCFNTAYAEEPQSETEAIIILSTNTIPEMHAARKILEDRGVRIRNIFPASVFIAEIPQCIKENLNTLDFIKEITYTRVDLTNYFGYDNSTLSAIRFWNYKFKEGPQDQVVMQEEMSREPLQDELIISTDLQPGDMATTSGAAASSFGKAYGAGYNDVSLYMAGDIAVGIFFKSGNKGDWTPQDIDDIYANICSGLNQFIDDEPNAHITFTYVKEVDASGIPNSLPTYHLDYVNNLRNIYNAHWAYMIIVINGDGTPQSNGICTIWIAHYGMSLPSVIARHETMHLFGGADQYTAGAGSFPTERWGYLKIVNANSKTNNGKGYFGGAGEGRPDIMSCDDNGIGVYSRGQIGWRDCDGDGILDPLDTYPDTVILNKTEASQIIYTGKASDRPLLNENVSSSYGNVTLNTITNVEYRVNNGAWYPAQALDGSFDSGEEDFTFTTPALKNGHYIVEIKATNSVGNVEISCARDEFTITNSTVTSVAPFASFSINPPKGSIESMFTMDASASSDIEDEQSQLQVRWDLDCDGAWDTGYSNDKVITQTYTTPGTKIIKLEVKNSQGLTNTVTKQVNVADANIPPQAFFTVTPENAHGIQDVFDVSLDASRSYDGEDNLQDLRFRWDFDDDGTWDTEYSNNSIAHYPYQLPTQFVSAFVNTPADAKKVYVSGNYAYVTCGNAGLQIFDVTNPLSPVLISSYYSEGGFILGANDVYVSGNYAYLACSYGLYILDITNPETPTLVGKYNSSGCGIYVSGGLAYYLYEKSLKIIDISKPSSPGLVGSCSLPSYGQKIYIAGDYAYLASEQNGLNIIDASNPESPALISTWSIPNFYVTDVYVSGSYAYIAGGNQGLQILDITNPALPTLIGSCKLRWAQSVYVVGNYAYTTDTFLGLQIIDISNPASPFVVSSSEAIGWGKDVYVSENNVYIAYTNDGYHASGLQIIDITKSEVADRSTRWRAKLEVTDRDGNISHATREIWVNTYNHPPSIGEIKIEQGTCLDSIGKCDIAGAAPWDMKIVGNRAYTITEGYTGSAPSGISILDVSNPMNPVLLGGNYYIGGRSIDVDESGTYAYIGGSGTLRVVDVSNPASPTSVKYYDYGADIVRVSGAYAYIGGYKKFKIVDILDPMAAFLVGSCDAPGYINDICLAGNIAYVTSGYPVSQLEVVDITNPAAPTLIGVCPIDDIAGDCCISGNYVYVASSNSNLYIVDITNPQSPNVVGRCNIPGSSRKMYISGHCLYIATTSGLIFYDVTNPLEPKIVSINSENPVNSVYVKDDYIYAAYKKADTGGIQILQAKPGVGITALAADPDIDTTWDGLLEYRWDFGSDGIWDTRFLPSDLTVLTANYEGTTITCEVRDRFGATDNAVFTLDSTPPTAPIVTDEGDSTQNTSQLYASWTSEDPESGIAEYQYKITQDAIDGLIIRDWTSAGDTPYITAGGLSLIEDKAYFFAVKAKNSLGLWSNIGYSDGITVGMPNQAPILNPIGNRTGNEATFFVIPKIIATDPDNDPITIEASNLPNGARFFQVSPSNIGRVEYKLSWPAKFVRQGVYENITFTARDSSGATDSETITITIRDTQNFSPVLVPIRNRTGRVGQDFVIKGIVATDFDNDPITIEVQNAPPASWVTQVPTSNIGKVEYKFVWRARGITRGVHTLTFIARDPAGGIDSETITITINGG